MLRSRARTATIDESVAKKMKEHQGELVKQKQDEGLKRFKGEDGAERDANEEVFKKYESYRRENMLPTKVDELRVGFFFCSPRSWSTRAHSRLSCRSTRLPCLFISRR